MGNLSPGQQRGWFVLCSGVLREVFDFFRSRPEEHSKQSRANPEANSNTTRTGVEACPKVTRTAAEGIEVLFASKETDLKNIALCRIRLTKCPDTSLPGDTIKLPVTNANVAYVYRNRALV